MRFIDLTGKRFGMLTVLKETEKRTKNKKIIWVCRCDCGNEKEVAGADLGVHTNSCGCMSSRNNAGNRTRTHGMGRTKIYNVYRAMLNRCYNANQKSYKDYGAKGIKVCDQWKTFEGFYADMGSGYIEGMTIERVDYTKGYSPENCKWITKAEQALNKSNLFMVEYNAEKIPLVVLCNRLGLNFKTVKARITRYNWDLERATQQKHKEPKN